MSSVALAHCNAMQVDYKKIDDDNNYNNDALSVNKGNEDSSEGASASPEEDAAELCMYYLLCSIVCIYNYYGRSASVRLLDLSY
jgi:hypothetical protein